ncbi:DUF6941 family protein [Dendrosporobacter sp. 1207_IL3150]|uniref:DUF6941 family protein n=1 Tax=Dendrosporobacter sp. 1207_IL3150 TaxID=3084054 RepID=UPI002FD8C833
MIDDQVHLQAALLCEEVTTDQSGRHNIYNEFSQYTMGFSQPFTVFTIWRGSNSKPLYSVHELTEIIAPDGRVVASGKNGPFSLPDPTYRQVNSLMLENIDFTTEGIYELKITLCEDDKAIIKSYTDAIMVV